MPTLMPLALRKASWLAFYRPKISKVKPGYREHWLLERLAKIGLLPNEEIDNYRHIQTNLRMPGDTQPYRERIVPYDRPHESFVNLKTASYVLINVNRVEDQKQREAYFQQKGPEYQNQLEQGFKRALNDTLQGLGLKELPAAFFKPSTALDQGIFAWEAAIKANQVAVENISDTSISSSKSDTSPCVPRSFLAHAIQHPGIRLLLARFKRT
jgi:hypothetical protein